MGGDNGVKALTQLDTRKIRALAPVNAPKNKIGEAPTRFLDLRRRREKLFSTPNLTDVSEFRVAFIGIVHRNHIRFLDLARDTNTSAATMRQAFTLKRRLSHLAFKFPDWRPVGHPQSIVRRVRGKERWVHVHRTQHAGNITTASKDVTNKATHSLDVQEATRITDSLLDFTRSLMDGSQHHIIAYSGGIDSSVVAALVHQSQSAGESVQAVLGISPAVPSDQVALAEQVAQVIGIPLEQIPTAEGNDATYIENSGQACLACKTHLYTCLDSIAKHASRKSKRLYNGTNADDLNDPTRLGLIAADRFDVQSPLKHTPKELVRVVGRHLGLPNWNYAASPCLRSRLAIGVEAIPQHLQRIERAETYVRNELGLDATHNLRVRLLSGNRAMIEVEEEYLDATAVTLDNWRGYFEEDLGFASVDVRSFKSGSVAKIVEPSYEQQEVPVAL